MRAFVVASFLALCVSSAFADVESERKAASERMERQRAVNENKGDGKGARDAERAKEKIDKAGSEREIRDAERDFNKGKID